MTYVKKLLVLGGLWLACSASAFSQDGDGYWKRLQKTHPETTLEALQNITPAVSQAPSGQPELPACRLALVYGGKTRDISEENLEVMKKKGLKAAFIRQFRKEMLFTAAEKEVWLPVKATLVDQLQIEVAPAAPVLLYTTVLQNPDPQHNPITLLVEDYQVK
jgi:hypothetical protein